MNKRLQKPIFVMILLLLALPYTSSAVYKASSPLTAPKVSTPFLLAGGPGDQMSPSIAGTVMVYSHCPVRNCDIWGLDLTTRQPFPISEGSGDDRQPYTDGVRVVWRDGRNSGSRNEDNLLNNFDIYGAYLEDRRPFSANSSPKMQNHPSVWGNTVVWADFRNAGGSADQEAGDIYISDFPPSPGKETLLTTARSAQTRPVTDGRYIGWVDYRNEPNPNGLNADIYGYDLSTKQEFPIYVAPGPQGFPRVWGNFVAWEDSTKGINDHDIFGATISDLPIPTLPVPPIAIPGGGSTRFPQTGKLVTGIFNDYWQKNGGLPQQGFPISDLMQEKSDLDGKSYRVQYFERAVFEYHPENAPPYNVLLSQLGTFRYKQKYPVGAPIQQPNNSPGSVLFPETGKRLGGKFLEYWQRNGGLPQQGFPISEEFTEVSDLDGKPYLVQYFERAVFELHPENAGTPYEVLLSQLGTFRYKEKYDNDPSTN